jgi:hypothetical protein
MFESKRRRPLYVRDVNMGSKELSKTASAQPIFHAIDDIAVFGT